MIVSMAGVDHTVLGIAERGRFAFTLRQAHEAMRECCGRPHVSGCVILSTCNRSAIWVSHEEGAPTDPAALLCGARGLDCGEYARFVETLRGEDAARYLFETACGLRSQIKFEDQILAQVKEALDEARKAGAADKLLERLFQNAAACAKQIKTQAGDAGGGRGLARCVLGLVEARFADIGSLRCLVIGSGRMGREVAEALSAAGAEVRVTARSRRHALGVPPKNCKCIDYDGRHEALRQSDVVVGATRSPHFTLHGPEAEAALADGRFRLLLDLAAPRDFDPGLAGAGRLELLDLDQAVAESLPEAAGDFLDGERKAAEGAARIIDAWMGDFSRWVRAREDLPLLRAAASAMAGKVARAPCAGGAGMGPAGPSYAEAVRERAAEVIFAALADMNSMGGERRLAEFVSRYMEKQAAQGRGEAAVLGGRARGT